MAEVKVWGRTRARQQVKTGWKQRWVWHHSSQTADSTAQGSAKMWGGGCHPLQQVTENVKPHHVLAVWGFSSLVLKLCGHPLPGSLKVNIDYRLPLFTSWSTALRIKSSKSGALFAKLVKTRKRCFAGTFPLINTDFQFHVSPPPSPNHSFTYAFNQQRNHRDPTHFHWMCTSYSVKNTQP